MTKGNMIPRYYESPPLADHIESSAPPRWTAGIALLILNGIDGHATVNGINFDAFSECIVLYRKLTQADRSIFPELEDVDEVWISYDSGTTTVH